MEGGSGAEHASAENPSQGSNESQDLEFSTNPPSANTRASRFVDVSGKSNVLEIESRANVKKIGFMLNEIRNIIAIRRAMKSALFAKLTPQ